MIRFAIAALLVVAAAIGCRRVVELSPSPDASQDAALPPDAGTSSTSGASGDAFDDEDSGVIVVFDAGLGPG